MNNVAVFVDDLIIFSKTEEEQLNSIKLILGKFIEKNIFINNEKSSFCTEKLTYLGFQIDQHGYKPDPSRLEDFTVCDKPKTTKQLQKMLGKINWYRIFVKDISTRLEPFYKQLKRDKNSKLEITDNNMKIVSEIYQELKNDALLYYPDLNAPFYIQADASDAGIGGILFQKNGIIGYYSKKLNDAQSRYSTPEKEMYAILMCLMHWRTWIGGSRIVVSTDSKNLMGNTRDYNKKIDRWKAILCEFNITYKHIQGKANTVADSLSREKRVYIPKLSYVNTAGIQFGPLTFVDYIKDFHVVNGHPGITNTIKTLSRTVYLTTENKKSIKKTIRNCFYCQTCKHLKQKYGKLHGCLETEIPLKDVSSDVYGPFSNKEYNNKDEDEQIYPLIL
jgi:hypothetical protein